MMIYPIDYRVIPTSELELNKNEVYARLQTSRETPLSDFSSLISELEGTILCKYSAVRLPISLKENNVVDFGFESVQSADLSKNLQGCNEAFIFGVTLGLGVDRFLNKLSLTSPSNHFIADAFASAYAESAADKAEETMKGSLPCKPRFSPGYGDLELTFQKKVLEVINSQKLLGISLNKSLLMSPMKSITAIMGVKNDKNN